MASATYCEWNTCESWQYCCGDICCNNNDIAFNVIVILCASLALLFLCCTLLFICRYSYHTGRSMIQLLFGNYKNLSRDVESSTNNLATCDIVNDEHLYPDPPPPYSEVVQIRK